MLKKRIISLLLTFVMILTLLPSSVFMAEEQNTTQTESVYISISYDGQFIEDKNGVAMAYRAVDIEELQSIDLDTYGLSEYVYDADGDGAYELTALHLYIYVHEEILGLSWSEVSVSGGAGSLFFETGIFGFSDCNLNYFLNGGYPAVDGWGLTADNLVISAGDFYDIAGYSCWNFLFEENSGFHFFADETGEITHSYNTKANEAFTVGLLRTQGGFGFSESTFVEEIEYEVFYGREFGVVEGSAFTDDSGIASLMFADAGTWYVWCEGVPACTCGGEHVISSPAYAVVSVTEAVNPDKEAAKPVINAINEIGEVTLEKRTQIKEARADYEALTNTQKEFVENYGLLLAAETALQNLDQKEAEKVEKLILAIGEVTVDSRSKIEEACSAYENLLKEQKVFVDENALSILEAAKEALKEIDADIQAADEVEKKIAAIGVVTLDSKEQIASARAAYSNLTDKQKAYVKNLDVLEEAERTLADIKTDIDIAEAVTKKIAAIGVVTSDKKSEIEATRKAYNALTDVQKALVENYETLVEAEKVLAELIEKEAQEVNAVKEKIAAIGTVTFDSKEQIETARKAFDALSDAQKVSVDNYEILVKAEEALAIIIADMEAADFVEEKIAAIGIVTLDSKEQIEIARKAYDALTDAQKAFVENYDVLLVAEMQFSCILKDKEAADAVIEKINEIGTVTIHSGTVITEARTAYDTLTDEQKKYVENYKTLIDAETAIKVLYEQAAKANHKVIYEATGKYISGLGTPTVGSVGGEWMIIDLVRNGYDCPEGYYENVVKYVEENINEKEQLHKAKGTDNSRVILALTAAGYDVTDVAGHNLLMGLTDMSYVKKQGINGPIWALIAFDSYDYEIPKNEDATEQVTREGLIAYILEKQFEDGGWAIAGKKADPDMTGMAIQALAPYYETDENVKSAVDKALTVLSEMQLQNGGYGSVDGACSESCAQVIVALTALGINPETDKRFVKNGVSVVDAMCIFAVEGGGFAHVPNGSLNGMATEQGQYALVAYFRFLDGKTSLYDMSDVTIRINEPEEEPDKEPEEEPDKEPEEEPDKEPEEEPDKEPDEEPDKEPEEEPDKEPEEEPDKEPEEEPDKEPEEEPDKEPEEEPDKEPDEEPEKEPNKEPEKEPNKEPEKEPEKEPMKNAEKIENVTDKDENAFLGDLEIEDKDILDKLLTEEEKQLVENGMKLNIEMNVEDITERISTEEKKLVEENLGKFKIGACMDITITKKIGDLDAVKITKTNGAITISIVVPEELQNVDVSMERMYKMMRIHEGQVDILDVVFDKETGVLTFETDAFSTYVLVYEDLPILESDVAITDGVTSSPSKDYAVWMYVIIVFAIVAIFAGYKKYRVKK